MLYESGITRELPVVGMIKDVPCLGIIDQLTLEETKEGKKLVITDFKTRNSKRAPSYEQKRRNRIQLQVYWFLLQNLQKGLFSEKGFKEFFNINTELIPSDELLQQLPEQLQTILTENPSEQLIATIFEMFQELPTLSKELQAVYLHRKDKTVVHTDRTMFHEEAFEVDINWAIEYWQGKRTPNECPQQWMCKFCPFTDKCHYYLKRYYKLEENKKSKKDKEQNLLDYLKIEKKKEKKAK
jgi:exonuclease V